MPLALQVNYFAFVAEEVRIGLASLGLRSLDELVGRADLLKQSVTKLPKTEGLDLSFLTTFAGKSGSSNERRGQEVGSVCWLCHTLLMPERCQLVLAGVGSHLTIAGPDTINVDTASLLPAVAAAVCLRNRPRQQESQLSPQTIAVHA